MIFKFGKSLQVINIDILIKKRSYNMLKFDGPVKKNKILVPHEFDDKTYSGALYGYSREDTGIHVILGWEGNKPDITLCASTIGYILNMSDSDFNKENDDLVKSSTRICGAQNIIYGTQSVNGVEYSSYYEMRKIATLKKEIYSTTQDLFSRNSGLLETDKMKEKTALIVGCGSVGSILSLQLARSGVGKFALVDTDTLEIHNICRHQCNLTDIGRFKTNAIRDKIIAINPFASVKCFTKTIENVTDKELDNIIDNQTIIISCADNRLSDAFTCEIAYERNVPFVSIGFWRRAFVCEITVCIPQRGDTCYRCALKKSIENGIDKRLKEVEDKQITANTQLKELGKKQEEIENALAQMDNPKII